MQIAVLGVNFIMVARAASAAAATLVKQSGYHPRHRLTHNGAKIFSLRCALPMAISTGWSACQLRARVPRATYTNPCKHLEHRQLYNLLYEMLLAQAVRVVQQGTLYRHT